ncbi:right-handed parallel beta-helix repeat-containing protein [Nannocystis bainbridge]|uniref:Right-handed parallel beta-helix repeat-containing protein n=1 Tax=Nannocystis bainbridge TaxID=2995303 RepID=A0ABT5E4S6_9BACT|nr:right-handed parallel beta-helix repeat-containing protein [Nannocystis bainbridge]MDC0720869.1 right-handed parallel beta-helix repeat-containing protein [Nannocystis bainbridge]
MHRLADFHEWRSFLIVTALGIGPACGGVGGDSSASGETSSTAATTDDATGSTSDATTPGDPGTTTTEAPSTSTGPTPTSTSLTGDPTTDDSLTGDSTTEGVDDTTGATTETTTDTTTDTTGTTTGATTDTTGTTTDTTGTTTGATTDTTTDTTGTTTGATTDGTTDTTGTTTGGSSSDGSTTDGGGDANVLYVHPDGLNSNPGTADLPLRTIQWAIDQAAQLGTIDTIRVAEGEYTIDYSNGDHIVIVDGISLYGGYRADWGERDPSQHVTKIVDASLVTLSSSATDPHRAIEVPTGVQAGTVIDGFHVGVARGTYRAAVFVRGDATISNNVLEPIVAIPDIQAYGLRVVDGHPTVVANRFRFQSPKATGGARAIHASASNGAFVANVLDLSNVPGGAFAIQLSGGASKVLGNSIYLNGGGPARGLYLDQSAQPIVDNNLIEGKHDDVVACIQSMSGTSVPSHARNNVFNCDEVLRGSNPSRQWTTVVQFENGLGANASANLKLPDVLVGPEDDLLLDAQSPCTVTKGGRDITAYAPADLRGLPRTLPLSIGAHEWDGACQ